VKYSADGDWLVYRVSPRDIYALSADGETVEVAVGSFEERGPALSPDGRWLAYQSDESGRYQIYVRPFPDAGQARWQVSSSGGVWPLWAPDGRTLYFRTRDGQVIAAEVLEGTAFIAGEQRMLFTSPEILGGDATWDLAPDGEHFVVIRSRGLGAEGELVLVDNITTELRERVK
jgi:serine/threonine-protein kinase